MNIIKKLFGHDGGYAPMTEEDTTKEKAAEALMIDAIKAASIQSGAVAPSIEETAIVRPETIRFEQVAAATIAADKIPVPVSSSSPQYHLELAERLLNKLNEEHAKLSAELQALHETYEIDRLERATNYNTKVNELNSRIADVVLSSKFYASAETMLKPDPADMALRDEEPAAEFHAPFPGFKLPEGVTVLGVTATPVRENVGGHEQGTRINRRRRKPSTTPAKDDPK